MCEVSASPSITNEVTIMPGPLGTHGKKSEVDSGTLARTRSSPPGVIGGKALRRSPCASLTPLLIHLDLSELIEIEQPVEGQVRRSGTHEKVGVFVKGSVVGKDANRPKAVLSIVREIFAPLADVIQIELSSSSSPARLLKAHFGWPLENDAGKAHVSSKHGQFYDPSYVGAAAMGLSRSRVETFKPVRGDEKRGVTAYVFEGAITIVIIDYLDGRANVENIFATAIAHELGHNLGLPHTGFPTDIMFIYADKTESDQKKWMIAANQKTLRFNPREIALIRQFLLKA